ncbi:MAG TPA: 2Fe-2S iron-sulfur cluster-binding protein [Polyangiaceae bacterium]|nr:2Fe-2S iron-sulfur cluster-binding protein [Polyangiaceae bacterium]
MSSKIRVLSDPPESAPALAGETILESLLQAGLAFPHNCQSGNCGACKCELVEGDILELPYSEYALSAEERSRGLILACRTQVWGDCSVRPLGADEMVLHPSRVMRCRVVEIQELTHDIRGLSLAIESGGPYGFSAGQHARLKFGPGIPERSYSMASLPGDSMLEFYVRLTARGQASGYVFSNLRVGAEVTVSGPLGNAYLRENHRGPLLAVAGGSGMAPIKSIVETALRNDPTRTVHCYFGVRDERDVYVESRLRELAQRHPNLRVHVVLSEASGATTRRTGTVATAVMEDFKEFPGFKAYVAGPPPMVEAVQRELVARGMAIRDIHADAFYSQADDAFNLP